MSKEILALNDLQWLIYYKTQPNQTKPNQMKPDIWCFFNGGTDLLHLKRSMMVILLVPIVMGMHESAQEPHVCASAGHTFKDNTIE